MPGPFIARRVAGKFYLGFIGNARRHDVTCTLCGAVGRDLPVSLFDDQWAVDHLLKVHPELGEQTVLRDLYSLVTFPWYAR